MTNPSIIEKIYSVYIQHQSVQTDTRKLKAGDLFFALKGDNFNGNLFAGEALEKGAVAVIADEDTGIVDERIIHTDDVLKTLQALSKHHRLQFQIPFLAITGSNGKTTTKELIHAVLSTQYKTYTTEGNLNNHIGIPLTLLKIKSDAEIAVVEMGANHQQEIAGYCQYVLPTHGLITNVGKAHLEGFGGLEGVRKGKGELYDHIRSEAGSLFINTDLDYLKEMSANISNVFSYGTRDADVTGRMIRNEPFLAVEIDCPKQVGVIQTQLVGEYNTPNVLAAVAVGTYFEIPPDNIRSAIEQYHPSNSRSQLIYWKNNQIILDAYNANPTSMKAAIENFAVYPSKNRILMLGSMAELGEESLVEHMNLLELIQRFSWNEVVLVGDEFRKTNAAFTLFSNADEAGRWLENQKVENSAILIKGSRSTRMEKILDKLVGELKKS